MILQEGQLSPPARTKPIFFFLILSTYNIMKRTKLVIFSVHGKEVEQIEGHDISLKQVEDMKCAIAFMNGVSFDDVEFEARDIYVVERQELSLTCSISTGGVYYLEMTEI